MAVKPQFSPSVDLLRLLGPRSYVAADAVVFQTGLVVAVQARQRHLRQKSLLQQQLLMLC